MGDDQRQRVGMARADVQEVDVEAVDRRQELRVGVQLRLGLAPVVIRLPALHQLLDGRQAHALRPVRDGLPVGPAGRRQTAAKIGEVLLGNRHAEGTDGGVVRRRVQHSGQRTDGACSHGSGKKTAPGERQ